MIYMISFDLHAPTNNRELVENSIKSLGNYCKFLTTTYLIKTDYGMEDVLKIVTKNADNNDRMIVCEVKKPIRGWLDENQYKEIRDKL